MQFVPLPISCRRLPAQATTALTTDTHPRFPAQPTPYIARHSVSSNQRPIRAATARDWRDGGSEVARPIKQHVRLGISVSIASLKNMSLLNIFQNRLTDKILDFVWLSGGFVVVVRGHGELHMSMHSGVSAHRRGRAASTTRDVY